jgi:dimeric dUTPase (all-alpha-NTP-PPase superfamily)
LKQDEGLMKGLSIGFVNGFSQIFIQIQGKILHKTQSFCIFPLFSEILKLGKNLDMGNSPSKHRPQFTDY